MEVPCLLLLVGSCLPVNAFSCGSTGIENWLGAGWTFLRCPLGFTKLDKYCRSHDSCYDQQLGKDKCDEIFCNCLQMAVDSTILCQNSIGDVFCSAVKLLGDGAYAASG